MYKKSVHFSWVVQIELALGLQVLVVHVIAYVLSSICIQFYRVSLLHQVANCCQIYRATTDLLVLVEVWVDW